MLAEIESGVITRLQDRGLPVTHFSIRKDPDVLVAPAAFCSVEAGVFRKAGNAGYRQEVNVYVTVEYGDATSEAARRSGVFPLLEGVVDILTLQTLGLSIDPLVPVMFVNITDAAAEQASVAVFQVQFTTSYTVKKVDDEEVTDLLRVGLEYYLQDPGDDGEADASDEVTIEQ